MNQSTTSFNAHANAPAYTETLNLSEAATVAAAAIAAGDLAGIQAILERLHFDPRGKEKIEVLGKQVSQILGCQIVGFEDGNGELLLDFEQTDNFSPLFFGL